MQKRANPLLLLLIFSHETLSGHALGSIKHGGDEGLARAEQRLVAAQKRFINKEKLIKRKMLAAFASKARLLMVDRSLSVADRTIVLAELQKEKSLFDESMIVPESEVMLESLWLYTELMHAAMRPVESAYQNFIQKHLNDGRLDKAEALTSELTKFQEKLPGRGPIYAGLVWKGVRIDPRTGNAVDLQLRIKNWNGQSLIAEVAMNQKRAVLEMEGVISGCSLQMATKRMLVGRGRSLQMSGFILGNRLILRLSGISTQLTEASGIVLLQR